MEFFYDAGSWLCLGHENKWKRAFERFGGLPQRPKGPYLVPSGSTFFSRCTQHYSGYYPWQSEIDIFTSANNRTEMIECIAGSCFIEFGTGDGEKIKEIFSKVECRPGSYHGLDISYENLSRTEHNLQSMLSPDCMTLSVVDFNSPQCWEKFGNLVRGAKESRIVVSMLGLTAGNFSCEQMLGFLKNLRQHTPPHVVVLMSLDSTTYEPVLRNAYQVNEAAQFYLNGVHSLATALEFKVPNPDRFAYRVGFVGDEVKMYLVSEVDQKCKLVENGLLHTVSREFERNKRGICTLIHLQAGDEILCGTSRKPPVADFVGMYLKEGFSTEILVSDSFNPFNRLQPDIAVLKLGKWSHDHVVPGG